MKRPRYFLWDLKEIGRNKIPNDFEAKIIVDEEEIKLSKSEKLLGLTINDTFSWSSYLYGNDSDIGLLRTLSKRVGMLTQLRKYMNPKSFVSVLNGIFMSKMIYGITAWGYVSGIPGRISEFRAGIMKKTS